MNAAHTIRCLGENSREQFLVQTLLDSYMARSRANWCPIDMGPADVVIVAAERPQPAFMAHAEAMGGLLVFYTSDRSLARSREFVLHKPATVWDLSCLLERLDAYLVAEKRLAEAFVARGEFEAIDVSSTISLRSILSC